MNSDICFQNISFLMKTENRVVTVHYKDGIAKIINGWISKLIILHCQLEPLVFGLLDAVLLLASDRFSLTFSWSLLISRSVLIWSSWNDEIRLLSLELSKNQHRWVLLGFIFSLHWGHIDWWLQLSFPSYFLLFEDSMFEKNSPSHDRFKF